MKDIKILIVEDNEEQTEIYKEFLKNNINTNRNIEIIATTKGILGIQYALKYTPQFIILDLVLPDIMGDVIVKKITNYYDPTIVLVTGYKYSESIANNINIKYKINKPICLQVLKTIIEQEVSVIEHKQNIKKKEFDLLQLEKDIKKIIGQEVTDLSIKDQIILKDAIMCFMSNPSSLYKNLANLYGIKEKSVYKKIERISKKINHNYKNKKYIEYLANKVQREES